VLVLLISGVVISSFTMLINDFCWKLFSINLFNSTPLTYMYTSTLLTIITILLWNPRLYLPWLLYLQLTSPFVLMLFFIAIINTTINRLHTLIYLLLVAILFELNQQINIWSLISPIYTSTQWHTITDYFPLTVTLNNFFIETIQPSLINNYFNVSAWNIIWTSLTPELHTFKQTFFLNITTQSLYTGTALYVYLISVVDLMINSTFLTFFIFYLYLNNLIKKYILIIL
jgi:hypothetical protein